MLLYIFVNLSLNTQLYVIASVEDCGSVEGYVDERREDVGDGARGEYVVDATRGEGENAQGQGLRRFTIEQMDGCLPMTIYPSDIP